MLAALKTWHHQSVLKVMITLIRRGDVGDNGCAVQHINITDLSQASQIFMMKRCFGQTMKCRIWSDI